MKTTLFSCLGFGLGFAAFTAFAQADIDPADIPMDRGDVVAHSLLIVSSEMVVDVYLDGKLVPAKDHTLDREIFGAQIEHVKLEIHEGDWIVLQAVNNDLRGGFPRYLAAAGMTDDTHAAFFTEGRSGLWTVCDDIALVPRFITQRDFQGDGRALAINVHWGDGDKEISTRVTGWSGEPIWGTSHAPWLKFVVPRHPLVGSAPPPPAPPAGDNTGSEKNPAIDLLTSATWKVSGNLKGWTAERVFKKDGTFTTPNGGPGNGDGHWKISKTTLVLAFDDGHENTMDLPLDPKGTHGVSETFEPLTYVLESGDPAKPDTGGTPPPYGVRR